MQSHSRDPLLSSTVSMCVNYSCMYRGCSSSVSCHHVDDPTCFDDLETRGYICEYHYDVADHKWEGATSHGPPGTYKHFDGCANSLEIFSNCRFAPEDEDEDVTALREVPLVWNRPVTHAWLKAEETAVMGLCGRPLSDLANLGPVHRSDYLAARPFRQRLRRQFNNGSGYADTQVRLARPVSPSGEVSLKPVAQLLRGSASVRRVRNRMSGGSAVDAADLYCYEELLNCEDPDCEAICTPRDSHCPLCQRPVPNSSRRSRLASSVSLVFKKRNC